MSNDINFFKIWEGNNTIIEAIQINKRCPVNDFLEEDLTGSEYTKLYVLFALLDKQKGRVANPQKLRKLQFACDGCFELKPTKQARISFIYLKEANHICLLDGFKKKQNKWPKNERKKTERLCRIVKEYENNRGDTNVQNK